MANVRNKGLVILTACGHSGIINTINYAKKVTRINKIYAVIGGFHLPADGGIYEQAIEPTIKELKKLTLIISCRVIALGGKLRIGSLKLSLKNSCNQVLVQRLNFSSDANLRATVI